MRGRKEGEMRGQTKRVNGRNREEVDVKVKVKEEKIREERGNVRVKGT